MAAGPAVAGGAPRVGLAVAAEIQLLELAAIRIPLEHHPLRPVVPDRCGDDDILTDRKVGRGRHGGGHARQPIGTRRAIDPAIIIGEGQ